MDLRNQQRIAAPTCFACRWAGRYVVVWPLDPGKEPEPGDLDMARFTSNRPMRSMWEGYTSGRWAVFYNVHEDIPTGGGQKLRSKHRDEEFCPDHWHMLFDNWIQIAWEERALAYIFDQWTERTEQ